VAEHDSVIPPGGSGKLTAALRTAPNQNGRLSKSISVTTDAPDARNLHLRFNVNVRAPVVARPAFRFNLTAVTGSTASTRVLLHRTDGKPLAIHDLTLDEPDLMVRARPVNAAGEPTPPPKDAAEMWTELATVTPRFKGEAGDVWIDLAVKASAAPGTRSGTLRFKTNHPDAPEMRLPYLVRVRPVIEARPRTLRLWLPEEGSQQVRSAIVSLRRADGGELTITEVEVSDPEVFAAAADSTAASPRQVVRASIVKGVDASKMTDILHGWIRVKTDDAQQPVVEIPVTVASRRPRGTGRSLPTPRPATPGLTR